MKLFKYIFWITLGIILIMLAANLLGITMIGSNFTTSEGYDRFISNRLLFNAIDNWARALAFLNLLFGGVLFIIRGIKNKITRHKDILIGVSLIILTIIVGLIYLILLSLTSV